MKKQTKQKFKNIWNKIKKPLMIFSFIFNIIFIIFIIVGCATTKKVDKTINSNENDTQEVNEEDTSSLEEYFPELKRSNLRLEELPHYPIYRIKDDWHWQGNSSDWDFIVSFNYYIVDDINGDINCNKMEKSGGGVYFYRVGQSNKTMWTNYVTINDRGYGYFYPLTFVVTGELPTSNNNFNRWWVASVNFVGYTDDVVPEEPDEPTEDYEVLETIYLSDNFVPSVYVCDNGEFLFNGFASHHQNADTFVLILDGFTFISNGEKFNTISIPFVSVGAGAPYVTQDGVNLLDTSNFASSYMFPLGLLYQYREDNNVISSVRVSSNRRCVIDAGSNNLVNSYDIRVPFMVWVNDNYRTLDVIENEETIISGSMLTINNKTSVELLSVTSNVSTSAVGVSDVNTLLKGAFSSLSSLFGLTILPGLTLGLLLFLPLVVTILIAVIRLIRK